MGEFKDDRARRSWSTRRIPISTLYELFLQDQIAFKGDVLEVLQDHRDEFVNYKLTWSVMKFLVLQLFPNSENSSMKDLKATKKEIAEHYDKVMLKKDETFLDIGCGWGSLVRHAAKNYGARAVGVTLSIEGAKYCRDTAKAEGLENNVNIMCMDYREIPSELKFDKVSSIEMAEHVGLKNFPLYLGNIREMMKDDGLFLMQVAGLRQGSNWQDIAWGLFMSRYIFPGADASTPLNWYVKQLEMAGFEVRSVETIGRHYSHTLHRWYDNFQKNRAEMEKSYGGYLCRLWDFFLTWSVVAAGQGSATCYQLLVHKNTYSFPRDVFCEKAVAETSVGLVRGAK